MNNTKQRNAEIAAAARQVLAESGADITDAVAILPLAKQLVTRTGCHISTAKRHVAKAVRVARGELVASGWGGKREGAAAPEGNNNAARSYPK